MTWNHYQCLSTEKDQEMHIYEHIQFLSAEKRRKEKNEKTNDFLILSDSNGIGVVSGVFKACNWDEL